MKSLINKFINTKLAINIRNKINFRPLQFNFSNVDQNTSVSDGFIWRTDNNFKTVFKFSDLLKLFYKIENSHLDLYFYNNNFNLIKNTTINNIGLSNEILIDKKFLNNYEGYGILFLFHKYKNFNTKNTSILSNRCYLGFSYKNNLPSFVHGNTYVMSEHFNSNKQLTNFINNSLFCNQKYRIQNNFEDFDRSELFIVNPTTKKIKIYLNNNNKFFLEGLHSIIIKIKDTHNIIIKSNCYFLRPIVFNYKKNFIDVYHS